VLLKDMAVCLWNLHPWNEAAACHKNAVEQGCPVVRDCTRNVAYLLDRLKQYEATTYEEALAVCKRGVL
jgi:hypothetical protein